MSMRSWTVSGFGVSVDTLNGATLKAKLAFLEKYLPDVMGELHSDMEEDSEVNDWDTSVEIDYNDFCEEWLDYFEDEFCSHGFGSRGFGVLFAKAINDNEEDFLVEYCSGEYFEEDSVLYADRLPWEMTDRVKAMCLDDMVDVFMKYLEELGITDRNVVDMCSVEYCG